MNLWFSPTISGLKSKHSRIHKVVFWKSCFSSCCLKTDSIYTWVLGIIFVCLYVPSKIFFSSWIWKNKFQMLYWEKQRLSKVWQFNNNNCIMFKLCSNRGPWGYVFTVPEKIYLETFKHVDVGECTCWIYLFMYWYVLWYFDFFKAFKFLNNWTWMWLCRVYLFFYM